MIMENFRVSLQVLAQGMVGIFLVTAVIIGTIMLLNRVTGRKKPPQQ